MIWGTGIDIVDIERIKPWLEREDLLHRYFSEDEISYVRGKGKDAAASLAAVSRQKRPSGRPWEPA